MKKIFRENVVKNVTVTLLIILTFYAAEPFFKDPLFATDKSIIGSMLASVGILAVIACFGNFAFTYEKVEYKSSDSRLLAHFVTGLLMYLIGVSLELTYFLSRLLIGDFPIFNLSLFVLYIASVLYDFWDLKRVELSNS